MPPVQDCLRSRTPPETAAYVARHLTMGGYGYWLTRSSVGGSVKSGNSRNVRALANRRLGIHPGAEFAQRTVDAAFDGRVRFTTSLWRRSVSRSSALHGAASESAACGTDN